MINVPSSQKITVDFKPVSSIPINEGKLLIEEKLSTEGLSIEQRNAQSPETIKSITDDSSHSIIETSQGSFTVKDPLEFACEIFHLNKNLSLSLFKRIKKNPSIKTLSLGRLVVVFPKCHEELMQVWHARIYQQAQASKRIKQAYSAFELQVLGFEIHHTCKLGEFGNKLIRASIILFALIKSEKKEIKETFKETLIQEFVHIHHHSNLDHALKGNEAVESYLNEIEKIDNNTDPIDIVEIAIAYAFTLKNPKMNLALNTLKTLCQEAIYYSNLLANFEGTHRNTILLAALTSDTEEQNKIIGTIEKETAYIRKEKSDILDINKIREFISIISQLHTDIHSGNFDEDKLLNQFEDPVINQAWQKYLQFHPCVFLADILAPRYREFSLKLRQIALDQGVSDQTDAIFDFSDKEEHKLTLPEGASRVQDFLPQVIWEKIKGTHLEDLINTPLINWPDIDEWMPQSEMI